MTPQHEHGKEYNVDKVTQLHHSRENDLSFTIMQHRSHTHHFLANGAFPLCSSTAGQGVHSTYPDPRVVFPLQNRAVSVLGALWKPAPWAGLGSLTSDFSWSLHSASVYTQYFSIKNVVERLHVLPIFTMRFSSIKCPKYKKPSCPDVLQHVPNEWIVQTKATGCLCNSVCVSWTHSTTVYLQVARQTYWKREKSVVYLDCFVCNTHKHTHGNVFF